jgi:hypothetical protein
MINEQTYTKLCIGQMNIISDIIETYVNFMEIWLKQSYSLNNENVLYLLIIRLTFEVIKERMSTNIHILKFGKEVLIRRPLKQFKSNLFLESRHRDKYLISIVSYTIGRFVSFFRIMLKQYTIS